MYRLFILNTAISAIAYFIISIIGIIVVGWLATAYGLAAYGVITLARLFMPTGLCGLLDLGAPENASHAVATARSTNDWNTAGAMLTALAFIVFSISFLSCIILFFLAPTLTQWFAINIDDAAAFTNSLQLIALTLPLSLIGLVAEGIIKGFERYGLARGIEVWTSLAYGIGCYLCIRFEFSYITIISLTIILSVFRAVIAILIGIKCFYNIPITFINWRTEGLARAWKRTCVTAPNKVWGTIQTQSQPFLIGVFLGTTSVAVYDVLMRLPRFAKAALGLINSAVIPFISKIEAGNQQSDVTKIVENGLVWIACMSAPPLFAAATFSEPLLELWIGKNLTSYWLWQSVAFSTPLLTVLLGFGFNSLFGRTHVYRILNKFAVLRIILQYSIALALMFALEERAFILGSAVAVTIISIWEFRLIFREHNVSKTIIKQIFAIFIIGFLLMALFIPVANAIHTITWLFVAFSSYTVLFFLLVLQFVLPKKNLQTLLKILNIKKIT